MLLLQLLFPFSDLLLIALVRERFAAHGTAQEDAVPSGHLPTQQALPGKREIRANENKLLIEFLSVVEWFLASLTESFLATRIVLQNMAVLVVIDGQNGFYTNM